MYITYRNTEENLRALAAHQYKISPGMRRDRRVILGIAAIILATLLLMIGRYTASALLISLAIATLTVVIMLWIHRSSYIRHAVAAHRPEIRDSFLGRIQTLSLTDSGLVGLSRSGKSRLEYERIIGIYTSGNRTFIYLNPVTALMLSEAATVEGDYHAFLIELRKRWVQAAA